MHVHEPAPFWWENAIFVVILQRVLARIESFRFQDEDDYEKYENEIFPINLVPRSLVDEAECEIWSSKKIQLFDWLDCERMTRVLSPARAMACAFSSLQFCWNIFTEEVVFRVNITCKAIFILFLKTFVNSLSHYQDKDFWKEQKKNLA